MRLSTFNYGEIETPESDRSEESLLLDEMAINEKL